LLLVINCTFCACATSTSCPNSVNSRLTHGECVPVSRAMRLRGILHSRTTNDPLDPHRWLAFAPSKFHY
jgi:hypothetical protein